MSEILKIDLKKKHCHFFNEQHRIQSYILQAVYAAN